VRLPKQLPYLWKLARVPTPGQQERAYSGMEAQDLLTNLPHELLWIVTIGAHQYRPLIADRGQYSSAMLASRAWSAMAYTMSSSV